MSIVRSPVRSIVRSLIRGVIASSGARTPLQRILALSPSLTWSPLLGSTGWQGTSGGALAASGQPSGLLPDLSQLGGKTQAEWVASAPELVSNPGGPYTETTGYTALNSAVSVVSDALVVTISAGQPYFVAPALTTVVGRLYVVTIPVSDGTYVGGNYYAFASNNSNGSAAFATTPTTGVVAGTLTLTFVATATTTYVGGRANTATTSGTWSAASVSVRELPGNHLRAGTWASPSDAARGTFQNNAINFNGSSQYYSLLNAISITESMTVVRAFKRASAGIRSIGLGAASINLYDAYWLTDNTTATALGNAGAIVGTANTSTGNFVFSSVRNAAATLVRRNGAQIGSTTAPGVANSFGAVGLMNTVYNSGEISFLAVFPTELTGADLALVEQIAASTNSAVLA